MKPKHKHRRSNSTSLSMESTQSQEQNSRIVQQVSQKQKQNTLIDLKLQAIQILQFLETSNQKINQKQTIVEELEPQIGKICFRTKKSKGLAEIQADLKNWGEFQENFLNIKLPKYIRFKGVKVKKINNSLYRHETFKDSGQNLTNVEWQMVKKQLEKKQIKTQ